MHPETAEQLHFLEPELFNLYEHERFQAFQLYQDLRALTLDLIYTNNPERDNIILERLIQVLQHNERVALAAFFVRENTESPFNCITLRNYSFHLGGVEKSQSDQFIKQMRDVVRNRANVLFIDPQNPTKITGYDADIARQEFQELKQLFSTSQEGDGVGLAYVLNDYYNFNPNCKLFKDKSGNNLLHFAAQRGLTQVVDLLLANGFDPTLQNNQGQTPIDMADGIQYEALKPQVKQLLSKAIKAQKQKGSSTSRDLRAMSIPPTANGDVVKREDLKRRRSITPQRGTSSATPLAHQKQRKKF